MSAEMDKLSERLNKAIDESFSKTKAREKSARAHFLTETLEKISSFFQRPRSVIGTLASAVLVLVMLYPGSPDQTVIGLSQLDRDVDAKTPRPKSVFAQQPKPGLTIVVTVENLSKELSQS